MIKHILKLIWNKKGSNALMVFEIFLSFLVLFAVLSYVFYNLERVNKPLGFETQDRWMISLDNVSTMDSTEAVTTMQNLKQNLLAQEEIEGVSFSKSIAPFTNNQWYNGNDDNGFDMAAAIVPTDIFLKDVLDLNIIEGRWFTEADASASYDPILVNKNFIDKYYPGKTMIDSMIEFAGTNKIIGVVDEYRYVGEFEEDYQIVFLRKDYTANRDYAILKMKPHTNTAYEEKLSHILNTTTKSSGSVIQKMEKRKVDKSLNSWILLISLLAMCGFLCLNVALGLFGVLSYAISKRKSEIGLRQALGAHSFDITKQFILEVLILAGVAIIIGIFFTIQVPLLKMTEYSDIYFYKAIVYSAGIILVLVFACALFPSLQAARITPANSLHED